MTGRIGSGSSVGAHHLSPVPLVTHQGFGFQPISTLPLISHSTGLSKTPVQATAASAAELPGISRHLKALFVLRNNNAAPIHLPMVIRGATNNALWVIYTPLDNNWFMFIPNAICVVLGAVLLVLYVMYRPSKAVQSSINLPDEDIAITIVVSPKTEMQSKITSASPSFQPTPSPLLPLSRENSFQLSSPSPSRSSSYYQLSSPAPCSRSGSFSLSRSGSFERGTTGGVLHIIRAPRE